MGKVEHSVIFPGVYVGENTVIKDSVVMPNTKIGKNCMVVKSIIGSSATLKDNFKLGDDINIALVGNGIKIE